VPKKHNILLSFCIENEGNIIERASFCGRLENVCLVCMVKMVFFWWRDTALRPRDWAEGRGRFGDFGLTADPAKRLRLQKPAEVATERGRD